MFRAFFEERRSRYTVVTTTVTSLGQVLDWVDIREQWGGEVPEPPPLPVLRPEVQARLDRMAPPAIEASARGPAGTVPILYTDVDRLAELIELPATVEAYMEGMEKPAPNANPHEYASSYHSIANSVFGTDGFLSVHYPSVQHAGEFSLGQTAVTSLQNDAPYQSVETGWVKYPGRYGDSHTHFFTFFTTNGYGTSNNNLQSWDTDYTGWAQYSPYYFPGQLRLVSPGSVQDYLYVKLWSGVWWIFRTGEWVGGYPATLFSTSQLRNNADTAWWFGEIVDLADGVTTQTDMGDGDYAQNHAEATTSYMDGLRVQHKAAGDVMHYRGEPAGAFASKPNCWNMDPHFAHRGPPASNNIGYDSHFFYGGPGKNALFCP